MYADFSRNLFRNMSLQTVYESEYQPPENELQKGNGEKKMSEHELRIQRSLQKLNVPEWYKNSTVPTQGFLLKRHSDVGQNAQPHTRWNASTLPSKTTSLSSLGSTLSTTPRSPTSAVLTSPSPTHYAFSRWSTSRLNSGTNSSSTSPCGSARSSFNYRQPYLGWRSQEKLSKPRTPAERLAAGLLPQYHNGSQQSSPSLTEVRSSIKEVTSAIVHYVSGTRESSDRLSPSLRLYTDSSSRSTSPRGSTGRLCWLESSFVGSRPLNVPETPSASDDKSKTTLKFDTPVDESYLNYPAKNTQKCNENQTFSSQINGPKDETIKTFYDEYKISTPIKEPIKQNPDMATLDDILDSLLGLSTASRTPSPAKTSLESETVGSPIRIAEDLRRSRGDNVDHTNNRLKS